MGNSVDTEVHRLPRSVHGRAADLLPRILHGSWRIRRSATVGAIILGPWYMGVSENQGPEFYGLILSEDLTTTSSTSNRPHNDIGNCLGLYLALPFSEVRRYL